MEAENPADEQMMQREQRGLGDEFNMQAGTFQTSASGALGQMAATMADPAAGLVWVLESAGVLKVWCLGSGPRAPSRDEGPAWEEQVGWGPR